MENIKLYVIDEAYNIYKLIGAFKENQLVKNLTGQRRLNHDLKCTSGTIVWLVIGYTCMLEGDHCQEYRTSKKHCNQ